MLTLPNERGGRLSPEEIDQIARQLTHHLTAEAPLEVVRQGTGWHMRLNYEFAFMAQITSGSQPYSWQEVQPTTQGTFVVPAVGRTGSLNPNVNEAWEMNGNTMVPAGAYVLMTYGFLNFDSTGQEYLFSYSASTMGSPPPMGTASVPLAVTSLYPVNGLFPAVILTFNVATNTFLQTSQQCWAVTTNLNDLDVTGYTGILVGHGGVPALDIYCINDNLVVSKSDNTSKGVGVNHILLDPPYTWVLANGNLNGQIVAERLFIVQDERGNPPVQHTWIEQFQPYYTWEIKQDPTPGQADIRRLFDVFLDNVHVQADVCIETFTPACTWAVQAAGLGGVTIRRIFNVSGGGGVIPDVANLIFTPSCAWNVGSGGACTATVERIFTVQTDASLSGQFNDVAGIRFIPDCAWTIANDPNFPCGITVARDLTITDDNPDPFHETNIQNVSAIEFYPYYTWTISSPNLCDMTIQRNLFVNTCGPDIWQINFSLLDFIVNCLGFGGCTVKTNGLTTSISVCLSDGFYHTLVFQDGLLQQVN